MRTSTSSNRWLIRLVSFLQIASGFVNCPAFAHQPHDPFLAVAVSPNFAQDQTIMVASDYLTVSIGVFLPLISTDGGVTFNPARGVPDQAMSFIRFSPNFAQDGTIFLGGAAGLYRSLDRGQNFAPLLGGGGPVLGLDICSTFAANGTMFLTTSRGVYRSVDRGNTFIAVGTPAPITGALGTISISPNFASDKTVVVGSASDGLFRSVSAGNTWKSVTPSQTLSGVKSVVFSPQFSTDQTIFAATLGTGVFVSIDGGVTWTANNSGLTDTEVTSLITLPGFGTNNSVMLTAESGVFVSNNRGQTWKGAAAVPRHLSPQSNNHYRTLAATKTSGSSTITFLGMFEGLWKSFDSGQSWTYIDMIPTYILREMRLSSQYLVDQTIFGTSYGGGQLFSNDGGSTWSLRNTGASNAYPDASAISPDFDQDQTLFAGIFTGLEISTNAGANWKMATGLNTSSYVRAATFSPNVLNDGIVLIGTDNRDTGNPSTLTYKGQTYPNQGLFRSTDRGNTWVPTSLGGPPIDNIVMSPAFSSDQTAFAAGVTQGLYKSVDGGVTWQNNFNLPGDPGVLQVALSPGFPTDHTLFASTSHSGIYKSVDGGANWSVLPNSVAFTALSFALSPAFVSDQTLYAGTFQSGLLQSNDGGNTYIATGLSQNFVTVVALSSGFGSDNTMFAATYRGIYKSLDRGNTWAFIPAQNRNENDRPVTVLLSGAWSTTPSALASTGNYSQTVVPGSSASINFVGTGINWIALQGPAGGIASVTIDGVQDATVSLQAAETTFQQVVYQKSGLACGPHTAVFTAARQTAQQGINLDAVDIYRIGCPY